MIEADVPESAILNQVTHLTEGLSASERVQWWCRMAESFAERQHTEGLDLALAEALQIASDEMCDLRLAARIWRLLVELSIRAEAWEYLVEESLTGVAFARMIRDKSLEHLMMDARYRAMIEMGFRPRM